MKFLASDAYLTMHQAVPQPQLDGRAPIIPQARLLGGGSAVNAMVYMRGQAADYDGWDRYLGQGSGWSYADLLPHFKTQEDNDHLAGDYHGVGGPLKVSHLGHHCTDEPRLRARRCRVSACRTIPTSTARPGRRRLHAAHHRPAYPPPLQRARRVPGAGAGRSAAHHRHARPAAPGSCMESSRAIGVRLRRWRTREKAARAWPR